MKKRWYVLDGEENTTSWPKDEDAEKGECFKSMAAAMRRARELADNEPRKVFWICEAVCTVYAPVDDIKIEKV